MTRRFHGLGNPNAFDELDHLDGLRRQAQAERNVEAPLVRINPPGLRNGLQGNKQPVTGGGPLIQVANFIEDDVNALPLTITLLPIDSQETLAALNPFWPFARVRWGARSAFCDVEVDVGRGCQFVVGGSTCAVSVGADATGGAPEVTAQVGAMLAPWTTARQMPVYRTRYLGALGPGVPSAAILVPAFAQTLTVYRQPATEPLTIDMLDSAAAISYSVVIAASTDLPTPIRLSNDIVNIIVTPNLAGITRARLVFELCL